MSRLLAATVFAGILVCGFPGVWPASLLQVGAFALAWGAIIYRKQPLARSRLPLALVAAAAWGFVQLACGWTVYRFASVREVLHWAAGAALFFSASQCLRAREARLGFLRSLVYFAFALSVLATLQNLTSEGKIYWIFPTPYREDVFGPFLSRNRYAAFIELVLPVAVVFAMREPKRSLAWALMAGAMYASVIASASRAGIALATAEILVLMVVGPGRRSGLPLWKPAGWIVAGTAVFTAVVGANEAWDRFREPDLYGYRREIFRSSVDMVRARPWTGFGLGAWPVVYPAYARIDVGPGVFVNRAHSDWLEWAAEGGIPFVLLLASVAAWGVVQGFRSRWGLGAAAFFCHCGVDYPGHDPALAALLFVMLGALAARRLATHPAAREVCGSSTGALDSF